MITSVQLQDFKGHRDNTVQLGRLTVLVGPNGSGKTSVLEALMLQGLLTNNLPPQVLKGDRTFSDLLRRGAQGPIALTSQGTWNGAAWNSRFELTESSAKLDWTQGDEVRKFDLANGDLFRGPQQPVAQIIGRSTLYKLNAARIAAAAYSDIPGPAIEQDGTNTAVALAAIKLGYDEDFGRIEGSLRRVIPNVERVRIRQAVVQRRNQVEPLVNENIMGNKVFFDFKGAPGVPAHAASEGTLITLALLTVLHGPNRPNILLLDDFAESLHPQAQMELVRLIKRLLAEIEDLQIVATTHSPYILDELDPSEIHAFALRDDGTVAMKRLSEHPEAEKMKGALSSGQLWSLDPEREWVLSEKAS